MRSLSASCYFLPLPCLVVIQILDLNFLIRKMECSCVPLSAILLSVVSVTHSQSQSTPGWKQMILLHKVDSS